MKNDNWFENSRKTAEQKLASLPLPNNHQENYRFTQLDKVSLSGDFSSRSAPVPSESARLDEGELAVLAISGAAAETFGEGTGLEFSDLLSAVKKNPKFCAEKLSLTSSFPDDSFAQVAAAHWQNGVFLYVPKNTHVELSLRAVQYFASSKSAFRSFIYVDEGAELHFVDEYASTPEVESVFGLVEIHVKKHASLRYVQVQQLHDNTKFFIRQEIQVSPEAKVELVPVYLGGASGQLRQETKLLGKNAEVSLKGAARGSQKQQFDFWINVEHDQHNTRSALDFWFVLDGESRTNFNGSVNIRKNGINTEAYQKSRALLLSTKASANAIPKLIIETDAVKCSHGASVASINPEQVHYLQSRGIQRREAEQMIIRGFTEPVLELLPTDALHGRVEQIIVEKERMGILQ